MFLVYVGVYSLAVATRAPAVLGLVLGLVLPGLVVLGGKLWLVLRRPGVDRQASKEIDIEGMSNFYTYQEIGGTK